jgi:hypothetical protein
VDSAGEVGEHTSIALDTTGYPHISYYDASNGNLKYTKWDGSQWVKADGTPGYEILDSTGEVGKYNSIALDISEYPVISYRDQTNGHLKFAEWNGSKWAYSIVDSDNVGRYSSLKSYMGFHYIAYYDATNQNLKFAEWNGSGWDIETVDSSPNVGQFCSLATHFATPHISYYDFTNKDLKYAKWNDRQWIQPEKLENTPP